MIYFDCQTRLFSSHKSTIILYHYTDKSNLNSIKKHGILSKYALNKGSNSLDTGLDPSKLKGLVYLTKSKNNNMFKRYSGLVTVSIPMSEYMKLDIIPDPYYDHLNKPESEQISMILLRMSKDPLYKMYMAGQIDQVKFDSIRSKSINQCIKRSAEFHGLNEFKSTLNPKNTIVIKGDIKPEWILKTEIIN